MSLDIQSLRKLRNADFSNITKEFEKASAPAGAKSYEDTRMWKLERDKAGNASATIRFLPRVEGDQLPWVKMYSHGFKGPTGKWYIENSLTTIGQEDPVGQLNNKLWNSTNDDKSPQRKQARDQKRRLSYIANILVVDDPKHPENNGQVKLFKFGAKIFDKIMDKARPTFEDEEPVNVFDFWEGANFKLRMKQVEGYPNYDTSVFMEPSPLGDDDTIVKVANSQFKLAEFIDAKNFKSYDELKRKLADVLNEDFVGLSASEIASQEDTPVAETPKAKSAPAPKMAEKKAPVEAEDSDDVMSYFASLADED